MYVPKIPLLSRMEVFNLLGIFLDFIDYYMVSCDYYYSQLIISQITGILLHKNDIKTELLKEPLFCCSTKRKSAGKLKNFQHNLSYLHTRFFMWQAK